MRLSILIPCLNEIETLGTCIEKSRNFLKNNHIHGEIVVADNSSTDGSQEIAKKMGARMVYVPERGYGSTLRRGIAEAAGTFIIMADADNSYDFNALQPFVEKLQEGYDLIVGNRFQGGLQPGAMPFLHRYIGNPFFSWLGRCLFRSPVGDFHCGLRGFRKDAIIGLNLKSSGMEFASEMIIQATLQKLKITEIPTKLYRDGRQNRSSHLRTWPDGWRHLKIMLKYSPQSLFFNHLSPRARPE